MPRGSQESRSFLGPKKWVMEICWPCWNSRESWVCYDGFPQNSLVRHHFPTFSPLKLQLFHLCPIFSQFFSYVFNMCHVPISFPLLLQYFPCWNGSFFHLCPRSSHTSSYFYIYIYICILQYSISIYIHTYIFLYISHGAHWNGFWSHRFQKVFSGLQGPFAAAADPGPHHGWTGANLHALSAAGIVRNGGLFNWLVLVGGLEHGWNISPIVGMMIQSDFHIFQGVETTNQLRVGEKKISGKATAMKHRPKHIM